MTAAPFGCPHAVGDWSAFVVCPASAEYLALTPPAVVVTAVRSHLTVAAARFGMGIDASTVHRCDTAEAQGHAARKSGNGAALFIARCTEPEVGSDV